MEISYKDHLREIVTSAWLMGWPVSEIWLNGEKLYPMEGNVATQLVVQLVAGPTVDGWNYWMHALDWKAKKKGVVVGYAAEKLVFTGTGNDVLKKEEEYTAKKYKTRNTIPDRYKKDTGHAKMMLNFLSNAKNPPKFELYASAPIYGDSNLFSMIIGGKTYTEGKDFTMNAETGFIQFLKAAQLPAITALSKGAKIKLKATVPERRDAVFHRDGDGEARKTYNLPLLQDTKFELWWYKGQKKGCAGLKFEVTGKSSGQIYVKGWGQRNGHGRGVKTRDIVYAKKDPVSSGTTEKWNNSWKKGDTQYEIYVDWYQGSYNDNFQPIYPKFTKEWDVEVLGVVVKQV